MIAKQERYVRRCSTLSVRFYTHGKENCLTNMERTLELKRSRVTPLLFGIQDTNLRYLEAQLDVHIRTHDTTVTVVGESAPTLLTVRLLEGAYGLLEAGIRLDPADLSFLLRLLENGEDLSPQTLLAERIAVPSQKRFISPKSLGQRRYIQAIRQHDLVIGIGPAGTGKTYLAMAIEVAPLAFMRGRTLNDSFIILDEAQNATVEQMKMFLTRLGFYSKAVITGDVTQVDLPSGKDSGLIQIQHILQGIQGIDFVYFSERDVVRHPLVQEIVKAYNRYEQRLETPSLQRPS